MHSTGTKVIRLLALVVCLCLSMPGKAEYTVLSGMFDGAEQRTAEFVPYYDCDRGERVYRESGFQVPASGSYTLYDGFEHIQHIAGTSIEFRVYEWRFDAAAPEKNLKQPAFYHTYQLSAGTSYVLVVQAVCSDFEGAWAVVISGQGRVMSVDVASVPDFTSGSFTPNDPTMASEIWFGKATPYKQAGPVRVSRSGTYYFSDVLADGLPQVSLRVYTAPVNPSNPAANLVAAAGYGAPQVELLAGVDYYFVSHAGSSDVSYGKFLYVLAPPAPFRINAGLAGSWFNPDTPGQGFFLAVFENLNSLFLGWFTFPEQAPSGDEVEQRWMTAHGGFNGDSANLAIEWTTNGGFNSAVPEPDRHEAGSVRLDFWDCAYGMITYEWSADEPGLAAASGVIPIERVSNESVALCETLYAGPGMPGPL